MGFDRVYPPEADIRAAIEDLKGDLDGSEQAGRVVTLDRAGGG